MQKLLAPAASEVVELLKEAVAAGRVAVMLLPASDWLTGTLTVPALRDGTESSLVATFGLLLGLTPAEGRLLVKLVEHDPASRTELHRALYQDNDPVTGIRIVNVTISLLRRKLSPHGVEIATVPQGYRLTEGARGKIRKLLAKFGEDAIAATTAPGPKAPKDDLVSDAPP